MNDTAFETRLKSYAEIGDREGGMVERVDRAVREGARPVIGADSSPDDIRAAFRHATLIEPQPIAPAVGAEVVTAGLPRRWYIATFAPRLVDKVRRGLDDMRWDFAVPMIREWQDVPQRLRKPGQPKKFAVERPLFGTYGFPSPRDGVVPDWLALERVDGLGHLLRRQGAPKVLPIGEVEKFLDLEAEGAFDGTRARPPKVKRLDRIVVTAGPFAGVRALVEMTVGERVKVLMDMLGTVDLPIEAVELAS